MPDGNTTVIIQGKKRFEIERVISEKPYITSNIKDYPEENPGKENSEFNAIIDSIKDLSLEIIKRNPNIPSEASFAIKNIESIKDTRIKLYSIEDNSVYEALNYGIKKKVI